MAKNKQGFDRVTVDDLQDKVSRVLTIASASIKSFTPGYLKKASPEDDKLVLTFHETGDAEYPLNATSFHLLRDRYGDDSANGFRSWVGQACVLTRVETKNPQDGTTVLAVWVARPKEWDQAVREHVSESKGRKRPRR